jgi:hypothetical protein
MWQLRDAFQGLIKFLASVAVADALQARPDRAVVSTLAGLLLKPTGLALGDRHTLIEKALEPLEPLAQAGRLGESGSSAVWNANLGRRGARCRHITSCRVQPAGSRPSWSSSTPAPATT